MMFPAEFFFKKKEKKEKRSRHGVSSVIFSAHVYRSILHDRSMHACRQITMRPPIGKLRWCDDQVKELLIWQRLQAHAFLTAQPITEAMDAFQEGQSHECRYSTDSKRVRGDELFACKQIIRGLMHAQWMQLASITTYTLEKLTCMCSIMHMMRSLPTILQLKLSCYLGEMHMCVFQLQTHTHTLLTKKKQINGSRK